MRAESLDLPPELKVLDESDIGFVSDDSSDPIIEEESISAFFHQRIERLVIELQSTNSNAKYFQ